jgi:hypothetical protein
MLKILDPRSGPVIGKASLAPRLASFDGMRFGVLWNGRSYGGDLFHRIIAVLKEKYDLNLTVFLKKAYIGNVAPKEYFDELVAKRTDAVLVGLGD